EPGRHRRVVHPGRGRPRPRCADGDGRRKHQTIYRRLSHRLLATFLTAAPRGCRWAVEFRDPRWLCDAVFRVLRDHNAALCIHDLIADHPRQLTADWVYLRFHGGSEGGNYPPQALRSQARRIRPYLMRGLDVFAYFNNDAHGYAVRNAADLKRYL